MDLPFQLLGLLKNDNKFSFTEVAMELVSCPICNEGRLLPLSYENRPYAFWICSGHACGYTIGRNTTEETFYKGIAASETVEKGAKRWVKYLF